MIIVLYQLCVSITFMNILIWLHFSTNLIYPNARLYQSPRLVISI